MNQDLDKLEREAEAMLASLARELSVQPDRSLAERVKATTLHEINEQWLAGQPAPAPSAELYQRVRLAVRRQLQRVQAETAPEPRWSWTKARPLLAAAAAIVIWLGVAYRVGWFSEPDRPEAPSLPVRTASVSDPGIDRVLLVNAADAALADVETALRIGEELAQVVGNDDQWEEADDEDVDLTVITELMTELETLRKEAEPRKSTSNADTPPRAAVG